MSIYHLTLVASTLTKQPTVVSKQKSKHVYCSVTIMMPKQNSVVIGLFENSRQHHRYGGHIVSVKPNQSCFFVLINTECGMVMSVCLSVLLGL